MATVARDAMGKKKLRAYADRGYYNAPEIKACADAGISTYVPKPMTSPAKAEGRFDKGGFIYIAKDDEYQCPAGQRAIYRFTSEENGLQLCRYWSQGEVHAEFALQPQAGDCYLGYDEGDESDATGGRLRPVDSSPVIRPAAARAFLD